MVSVLIDAIYSLPLLLPFLLFMCLFYFGQVGAGSLLQAPLNDDNGSM